MPARGLKAHIHNTHTHNMHINTYARLTYKHTYIQAHMHNTQTYKQLTNMHHTHTRVIFSTTNVEFFECKG